MKRNFAAILSMYVFYSSIGFCASNPVSQDWVKQYVQAQIEKLSNNTTYKLYQQAQGGIIYYLDSSKKHGLVAATTDIANQQQWVINNTGNYTGAALVELFQGFQNTTLVLNSEGTNAPAASSCNNFSSPYSGWYLPSLQELNQMYFLMTQIGGFTQGNAYWSSSESTTNASQAWAQIFGTSGQQQQPADKTSTASIRCIRAF